MIETVYKEPPLLLSRTIKNGAEKYRKTTIHFVNDSNEAKGFCKAVPLSSRMSHDSKAQNRLLEEHFKRFPPNE